MPADQQIIACEVNRIAEELIALSHQDAKGIYWITPAPDVHTKIGESIDLFNGNAGIIIFFLSLYRYQPDDRYLDVCLKAARRLLQHQDVLNPKYYTFYGGAAGILYLCVQLFKVTGDDSYIKKAIQLERSYRNGFDSSLSKNDLLSGRAGNLLAVSHLYACSGDASLLETIHSLIQKLLNEACIAPAGLKWDTHKHQYDSLTGFSHGAAGIGFALMQTGRYFNAPGLLYLAELALLYEMNYFDEGIGNWMDLRVGIVRMNTLRQQFGTQLFQWPLTAFQPTMSGISSWAHGAAGCGLSRLSAFEITGNHLYADQALRAMEYSWLYFNQQKHIDYSLCSGYGGIATLFQQGARILQQPCWHERSHSIALAAIEYNKKHQTYNSKLRHDIPDPGLFSGLAGIGYWMLGCLKPHDPDTIVHPCLTGNNSLLKNYSISTVKHVIFNRYFPCTLQQIADYGQSPETNLCDIALDIHSLETLLQDYINKSDNKSDVTLSAELKREQQIVGLWKRHHGYLQFRQRSLILQDFFDECLQWSDHQWLQQTVFTDQHVEIINPANDNEVEVVYCYEAGLAYVKVTRIAGLLLEAFRQQQQVGTLISGLRQRYFSNNSTTETEKLLLLRIKELVKSGLLIRP